MNSVRKMGNQVMMNLSMKHFAILHIEEWFAGFLKNLDQKNRKRLPACVVLAIRNRFPVNNGEYTGFKYPC